MMLAEAVTRSVATVATPTNCKEADMSFVSIPDKK
jgi:hypothetical protein